MKIRLNCMDCMQENEGTGVPPLTIAVPVNDGRLFEMTCPNGHKTLTIIQQPKYEVLFELVMNALVDGYTREAVTSFASCLENFYEFCINQVSLYKGVNQASLEKGWKDMAKQSERQLGAFVMLWINYFGSAPTILSRKSREFRNKIVHEGYIPPLDEALEFGDNIVACVASNLQDMQCHLGDDLDSVFRAEFLARASSQNQQLTTQFMASTIGWARLIQNQEVNLQARLDEIEEMKVMLNDKSFGFD